MKIEYLRLQIKYLCLKIEYQNYMNLDISSEQTLILQNFKLKIEIEDIVE